MSAIMDIVRAERAQVLREAGQAVLDAVRSRSDQVSAMLRGDIPARWVPAGEPDLFWDWLLEVPEGWMGKEPAEDVRYECSEVWSTDGS